MDRPPLFVVGMQGLGDCINQRPVLRAATEKVEVYLATPWPQVYSDLPIKCVRWQSRLRMQARNEAAVDASVWHDHPGAGSARLTLWYHPGDCVHQRFDLLMPLAPDQEWRLDLPRFRRPRQAPTRPYAVVRPVTSRGEFSYAARNPEPQHIARAAEMLRELGIAVVSLAALAHSEETLVGEPPDADVDLTHGELSTDEVLGLIQGATVCVGGEGFMLPAAMASRVPMVTIYSAHGQPLRWTPHRPCNIKVASLVPAAACGCFDYGHQAVNLIANFDDRFSSALQELRVQ